MGAPKGDVVTAEKPPQRTAAGANSPLLQTTCQSAANVSPGAACNFSPPCVRWNARLMPVFSGAFLVRC